MKSKVASSIATTAEKFVLTLIIAACASFHACKKTDDPRTPPPPPNPPGTKVGLLKEMNTQSLPSPLYRFDYTDLGMATTINFSSGFFIYQLQWKDGKLDRMINSFNQNALIYSYTNGKITGIREVRTNNTATWNYQFDYNHRDLISEIRWYRISPNGADSFVYRKVVLNYRTDRNVSRYDDYRNLTGQLEWMQTTEYVDFDKGKNVDDFNILKEFDDNLLYLPGVKLQVNNPLIVFKTSAQNDHDLAYTWTYENGLPVNKRVKNKQVRGSQAGQELTSNTTYSYY